MKHFLAFVQALLELAHALTDSAKEFRNLLSAKQNENDYEYEEKLLTTETKH